jgi:adenylate kinase
MKQFKNILIIGPQGSGKDTQAVMLSKKRKIPFIVMGDLFRQEIKKKTPAGKLADRLIRQGRLAPDKITFNLLQKRLRRLDAKKGFILNGFPRNLKQALMLEKIVHIDLVLELWISDRESLRRLSGRRFCPRCQTTYHLIYKKSKKPGLCDKCEGKLRVREDDRVPVIKKRLRIYHQQTEPILNYYKKKKIHLRINGEQPIPRVSAEILHKIRIKK